MLAALGDGAAEDEQVERARVRFHSGYVPQRDPDQRFFQSFESAGGVAWHAVDLGEKIRVRHRIAEAVTSGQPDLQPALLRERDYAALPFPPRELRQLAWFRWWGVIHYFFPNPHPFDRQFAAGLELFEQARDARSYALAIAETVRWLNDGQAMVYHPGFEEAVGAFAPGAEVKWIAGENVITAVFDRESPLAPGDRILEVDGESVWDRRARLGRLFSAATEAARAVRVSQALLAGERDSVVTLGIRTADGFRREIRMVRTFRATRALRRGAAARRENGVGYIDLVRIAEADLSAAFAELRDTRALILDTRGAVQPVAAKIAAFLSAEGGAAAQLTRPEWRHPARPEPRTRAQTFAGAGEDRYRGRIVVLANEETIGMSERACLFFEAAGKATFAGSPTAGSAGDVTNTVLPGGATVVFTGQVAAHADGRRLEGVGIAPAVKVAPTLEGVAARRDEVLERAFALA
jgi:C-terminal processing protease CtpA/Prc